MRPRRSGCRVLWWTTATLLKVVEEGRVGGDDVARVLLLLDSLRDVGRGETAATDKSDEEMTSVQSLAGAKANGLVTFDSRSRLLDCRAPKLGREKLCSHLGVTESSPGLSLLPLGL